ncbi:DNA polymerase subunit gamma-2, mitochondrial, partial [Ixodes scapularis]
MSKSAERFSQLLQRYGYTCRHSASSNASRKYGPCGFLLRDNLQREWRNWFLQSPDTNVFPFEDKSEFQTASFTSGSFDPLSRGLSEMYSAVKDLADTPVPFGVVCSRVCKSEAPSVSTSTDSGVHSSIAYPELWTLQQFAFFTPPAKLSYWFAYWQRERLKWWKKFSKCPSDFSLTEITDPVSAGGDVASKSGAEVSVIRKLPWGGSEAVERLRTSSLTGDGSAATPHAIVCDSSLEVAAATYVSDGLSLRDNDSDEMVLRLHHKLAPYKTTVATTIPALRPLSSLLQIQLKRARVAVYCNPLLGTEASLEEQIS